MKFQTNIYKVYFITCILFITILLIGGCNREQQNKLEKTKIPNVNSVTETTSESPSETTSETTSEPTTGLTSEVLSENEVYEEPYLRPYDAYINQNDDFMGWIKIDGTNIDEPLVQGDDNAHYLEYDYTGAKNYAGAVFIDYKNLGNFYDNHMSLYAHYMEDGTMFHDLHNYKASDFLNDYPEITLSGLRETKTYEIFSVHIVSAYDYYLYLNLSDDALVEYAEHFKRLSMHDKSVTFPKDLKLLTLVTCTYEFENARLLIHAYQK